MGPLPRGQWPICEARRRVAPRWDRLASQISEGANALRAFLAITVLLCAPCLAATAEGPRPPCADLKPFPDYAAPGAAPSIRVWTNADLGAAWTPPACTGWTAKSDGVLVAVAGEFPFRGGAGDLLKRFGAISALAGLRYWSVTEGGWRTLIAHATALEGPDATRPRPDFTIAEMRSGADLYLAEADNRASGEIVYRMRLRSFGPNGFVVAIKNASPVSRFYLTLFEPGDLQSVHFLERIGPQAWAYYGLAWAGERLPSRLAVPKASYVNRALALYRYFTGAQGASEGQP
jgi:hypothetical protein